MIEFRVEENSPASAITQIQEQIRLALSMGTIRGGDILPSIRDVAQQTGVNRGKVYQAYLDLEKLGLVVLKRGRSVVADTPASSPDQNELRQRCHQLSRTVLERASRLSISPTALARYLVREAYVYERAKPFIAFVGHKTFATDMALEISKLWGIYVAGFSYEELKGSVGKESKLKKVLVHNLRFEFVHSLVNGRRVDIIPVGTRLSDETVKAYQEFKPTDSVVLMLHEQEYSMRKFILEQGRQWIHSRNLSAALWKGVASLRVLMNERPYDHICMDHHMWSDLPAEMRRDPRILLACTELDLPSVEAARIRAGIII